MYKNEFIWIVGGWGFRTHCDSFRFIKQKLLRIKFPNENLLTHASLIPPGVEMGGSKVCHFWYIYNELKLESKFTLGMSAAKNTNRIKKWFKQQLLRIKFPKKTWWVHIFISTRSGARWLKDCSCFNIMIYWNGKIDSL